MGSGFSATSRGRARPTPISLVVTEFAETGGRSPAPASREGPHLDRLADRIADARRPVERSHFVRRLDQVEAAQLLLRLGERPVGALRPAGSAADDLRLARFAEPRREDE